MHPWPDAFALMGRLETRIERLEAASCQKPRPGISAKRRKALTDRAVLHGDLEALQELSLYRPDKITASKEQCAAAGNPSSVARRVPASHQNESTFRAES